MVSGWQHQGLRWPRGVGNREGRELSALRGAQGPARGAQGVLAPGLAAMASWAPPTLSEAGPGPACGWSPTCLTLGELAGPGPPWTWLTSEGLS